LSTLKELEYEQVSPRLLEILRREGYVSLTQFQTDALAAGIMRGENLLLVTYDYDEAYEVAEIAVLNTLAADFRARAIIVCPNRHLVEKRLKSLRPKCRRLGVETTVIVRRRTAAGGQLKAERLIVASFHSLSIILRSHPEILNGVRCVLIERLDLIGEPELGARLETAIVTLMGRDDSAQCLGILPPVADLDDLSSWLKSKIVTDKKSEVRRIFSVKVFPSVEESLTDLTEFVHYKHGQTIILASNMKACETLALALSGLEGSKDTTLDLRLTPEQRDRLLELVDIVGSSFRECRLTQRLVATLRRGVAFLHEGIPRAQRREVSAAWEEGVIPVLVMPTRFAIASGLRATVVFVMGVFMQTIGCDLSNDDSIKMLTEWQLSEVLYSAGRTGMDTEGFGIVVVDSQIERQRVLDKYFVRGTDGELQPRLGEVDSSMDDPENAQDLVLSQMCGQQEETTNPFAILDRTYWAASHRVTDVRKGMEPGEDIQAEILITLRATNSTIKRAENIPDSSVRLVSVTPTKIEGLVRSGSREIWHYVTLRSTEGVSCSCESWKFQGISKHRLCKHLVKFANFALRQEETRPYAASVIQQALRGLSILDELEREGLVTRRGAEAQCTSTGRNVVLLGVPVPDAKRVLRAIRQRRRGLSRILVDTVVARTGFPESIVRQAVHRLPAESIEAIVHEEDMPGLIENIVEEVYYVNTILLGLMSGEARRGLNKEALSLQHALNKMLTQEVD